MSNQRLLGAISNYNEQSALITLLTICTSVTLGPCNVRAAYTYTPKLRPSAATNTAGSAASHRTVTAEDAGKRGIGSIASFVGLYIYAAPVESMIIVRVALSFGKTLDIADSWRYWLTYARAGRGM